VILPMRELVNVVMRHADDLHPELVPYYDDLYDHVLRAAEWTESLRDMISSIFETNLSLADSRLNTIMKKLTAWAAIIAVPTAVTGFYGQNVPYPGFGAHWGFWVSTVVMLVMAGGLYALFRRKDWI
jgi:magnesium transporter